MLILPWPAELTAQQKDAVAKFEGRGGVVHRLSPDAGWNSRKRQSELQKALANDIARQAELFPIRINGPKQMHATCFKSPTEKRYTLCLVNSWSWFRSERYPDEKAKDQPEPPACTDVVLSFASPLGQPRKVFDTMTGKPLPVEAVEGVFRVRMPAFPISHLSWPSSKHSWRGRTNGLEY